MRRYRFYKFRCTAGHVFQALSEASALMEKRNCQEKGCRRRAVPESLYQHTKNALAKATVVFERVVNGRKERMYPVDPNDPREIQIAKNGGYERREIQGVFNIRNFEREVSREMQKERSRMEEYDHATMSRIREQNRSELRSLMDTMTGLERDVAEEALRRGEEGYSQRYDPEFRIGGWS